MKFSTNFVAMLSLVGRIKFSLNCHPALELRDITHVHCTYTHLFTGRISKLGLHPLQSYGCIRITSWITLVVHYIDDIAMNRFFTFTENNQLRGHNLKLIKPRVNKSIRLNSFAIQN